MWIRFCFASLKSLLYLWTEQIHGENKHRSSSPKVSAIFSAGKDFCEKRWLNRMVKPHGNQNLCNKGTGHQSRYALYQNWCPVMSYDVTLDTRKTFARLAFSLNSFAWYTKNVCTNYVRRACTVYLYAPVFFSLYLKWNFAPILDKNLTALPCGCM